MLGTRLELIKSMPVPYELEGNESNVDYPL
jgi:hypothetical protein